MNIGIIGGGSIGLLMGGYLAKLHDVTLYVRREQQKVQIEAEQVQLQVNGKKEASVKVKVENIGSLTGHDCLFVCVKQPQLENVLAYLQGLNQDIPLVFLQNGMGHIELVKTLAQPTYLGIIEHGASKVNDHTVNHLGKGRIVLGRLTGSELQLRDIIQTIDQTNFPFEESDQLNLLLKEKLIINAVINPLTALFDLANGAIIENEHIKTLAKKICQEVADTLELNEVESWNRVKMIAHNTRKNTSSMRADLQEERTTEIESIIGYIIKQSKEELPFTSFVYHSILAKSN